MYWTSENVLNVFNVRPLVVLPKVGQLLDRYFSDSNLAIICHAFIVRVSLSLCLSVSVSVCLSLSLAFRNSHPCLSKMVQESLELLKIFMNIF